MPVAASTVDPAEVEQFSRLADQWWDERGPFAPLHRINPLRLEFIRDQIKAHFGKMEISALDIGCGGGLVCEPLTRLGANVTGIDASGKNIEVAKLHAARMNLAIDYRCMAAEELAASGEQFDVVLALEIVEHVADVTAFVKATAQLVRPGGLIIYSTLNRTAKAFAMAIVGAEYILRWLPRGTHDWQKFLKPSELCAHLRASNIDVKEMTGMVMNPLDQKWRFDPRDLGVNYFVAGTKPAI